MICKKNLNHLFIFDQNVWNGSSSWNVIKVDMEYDMTNFFSFSKGFRMPQKVLNLKQILAFKHILFYKYDAQDIWYFKRRFAASIVITHILRKEKVYPSVYFVFKPYYRLNHLVKWVVSGNLCHYPTYNSDM